MKRSMMRKMKTPIAMRQRRLRTWRRRDLDSGSGTDDSGSGFGLDSGSGTDDSGSGSGFGLWSWLSIMVVNLQNCRERERGIVEREKEGVCLCRSS